MHFCVASHAPQSFKMFILLLTITGNCTSPKTHSSTLDTGDQTLGFLYPVLWEVPNFRLFPEKFVSWLTSDNTNLMLAFDGI